MIHTDGEPTIANGAGDPVKREPKDALEAFEAGLWHGAAFTARIIREAFADAFEAGGLVEVVELVTRLEAVEKNIAEAKTEHGF